MSLPSRTPMQEVRCRGDLKNAQCIVVKAGTSIVVGENGFPSLKRIGYIAEQICQLRSEGKHVIFVSSGAIAVGRNVIRRQEAMQASAQDRLSSLTMKSHMESQAIPTGAIASTGQASLQNLYQTLFSQLGVTASEILLTKYDFETIDRQENVRQAIEWNLRMDILPIINENDAVTGSYGKSPEDPFYDNDGLAALVAGHIGADLMVLLTDVEGLYDKAPTEPGAKLIKMFCASMDAPVFGEANALGRGGMKGKISAAMRAVQCGVPAVVVTSGRRDDSLLEAVKGEDLGTMIIPSVANMDTLKEEKKESDAFFSTKEKAAAAKAAGRNLVAIGPEGRTKILRAVADALSKNADTILAANAEDLKGAEETELAVHLKRRLTLTRAKLEGVVDGVRQLAEMADPVGEILTERLVAQGVKLRKVTTPIGTLMVIFESRPDCLPQIAALCLRSGNSVLLKGGKEAEASNRALLKVLTAAVESASGGAVSGSVIGLVSSRSEIKSLLKLNEEIDLVVPRGSNAMVAEIQASTTIPVLGHADGVCHVFVHSDADIPEATRLLLDAKLSYPAACNATETLLLDAALEESTMNDIIVALRKAGVRMFGGPKAVELGLVDNAAPDLHKEYGDLRLTVEVVEGVNEAISHINKYGSHHTDSIVTNNAAVAKQFTGNVDSACTFHNVSTRMADGYRFGLGAEVGISTSRIHARGPVGVEGLLTFKWVMATGTSGGGGEDESSDDAIAPVPAPGASPVKQNGDVEGSIMKKGRVCLTVADFEAEKKRTA